MSKAGKAKRIVEDRKQLACGGWPVRTLLEAGDIPIAQIKWAQGWQL